MGNGGGFATFPVLPGPAPPFFFREVIVILGLMLLIGNVLPVFATDNAINGLSADVVLLGKVNLSGPICKSRTNSNDLFFCQFAKTVLASGNPAGFESAFVYAVLNIVTLCSNEEMFWVDAGRIVPGRAIVTNHHAVRNGTIDELPAKAMGKDCLFLHVKESVSKLGFAISGSIKNPTAIVGLFYSHPESCDIVASRSNIDFRHVRPPIQVVMFRTRGVSQHSGCPFHFIPPSQERQLGACS